MAIKIKKNGAVQDLVINANEVRVLDTDGNFRSKNLESVLKELNATSGTGTGGGGSSIPKEADYVFVADTEPDYDGVWLDTSEDCTEAVEGDNGIVKAIRDYIDTDVKATVENNRKLVQENNKVIKDIQTNVTDRLDVIPQLSNPNLLINGDFQVWQRGNNFNITKDGKYNYTADRWVVQTDSDGIIVSPVDDGGMRVDMSKFKGTYTNVIQFLELSFYKKLIGKTVTIKIKFKNEVSNIAIGLRAFPDASTTHTLINETASEFTITATIPKCSVECTKFMVYIQSKTQQILDFEYIKMELGNSSTPFIPRLYDEELALCRRYFERVASSHGFGVGFCVSENTVRMITRYSTKRIRPTVTLSVATTFSVESGRNTVRVTRLEPLDIDEFGNGYMQVICEGGLTTGYGARLNRSDNGVSYIDYNAEIY